jgi:esterase
MIEGGPVRDRTVTLNGLRFHCRDWGDEAAPPLVLLHAYTHNARTWDTVARGMLDRYRVLALDQRGHGETEWAAEHAPERFVEDIEALAAALDLDRFDLVGFSVGGHSGYPFAARHPEMVGRLVLVETVPDLSPGAREFVRAWLDQAEVFADPEAAVRSARALTPRAPEEELRHWVVTNLFRRDGGGWIRRYDPVLRSANPPTIRPDAATLWATMPRLACPTLVVRGAESELFPRDMAERMARAIPNGDLLDVPNAGHWVPLDNPRGFLGRLREFLARA